MKANYDFGESLLENAGHFTDPFFQRFSLRQAPQALRLSDKISKNYFFPTFYADVTCAIGIFLCSYEKAKAIMPNPAMNPVRMTKGRSLVIFSCYEYKNVMNIPPYNEVAMTIPVMVDAAWDVPVLPMLLSGLFEKFGYYVFGMPVTSKENQIRGNQIWGLPKVTQDIDLLERGGDLVTVVREKDGTPYFELYVPMRGTTQEFDVRGNLYSALGENLLQSQTCFKGAFQVNKHMKPLFRKGLRADRPYLRIGHTPSADILRSLEIEEHPFQFRFAKHMNSSFDLPNQAFQLKIPNKAPPSQSQINGAQPVREAGGL